MRRQRKPLTAPAPFTGDRDYKLVVEQLQPSSDCGLLKLKGKRARPVRLGEGYLPFFGRPSCGGRRRVLCNASFFGRLLLTLVDNRLCGACGHLHPVDESHGASSRSDGVPSSFTACTPFATPTSILVSGRRELKRHSAHVMR